MKRTNFLEDETSQKLAFDISTSRIESPGKINEDDISQMNMSIKEELNSFFKMR